MNLKKYIKVRKHPTGEEVEEEYGGSQLFTPTDLEDLALWFDASDLITINTGSPSDGDSVSVWIDKSGNGYNATQETSDNKPTFKTSIQNGNSIIRCDSSENAQFLELSEAGLDLFRALDGLTVAMVGQDAVGSPLLVHIIDDTKVISADIYSGFQVFRAGDLLDAAGAPTSGLNSYPFIAGIGAFDFIQGIAAGRISLDGTSGGYCSFTNPQEPTPDVSADSIFIGKNEIGTGFTGDVAEIIIYRRSLNLSERRSVLEYLSSKWNCG